MPRSRSNGCSMCRPKDSMEDEMILRIVYLEHYRYWITLNRGRLRTDHKTKFRRRLKFTPSRNFFLMSNDQNRLNGINNTWDKPSTFQQKEDSIFLNILNLFPLISWTIYFLLGFNGKFPFDYNNSDFCFKTWSERERRWFDSKNNFFFCFVRNVIGLIIVTL